MMGISFFELVIMIVVGLISIGVPIATLVLVVLIYRNTRK
jgi:hypothetical protein